MTVAVPEVTTRPLFWIAREHGADYTDVLLAAEGLKCSYRGQPIRHVWVDPAINRLTLEVSRVDGKRVLRRILDHVKAFVAQQDGTPVEATEFGVQPGFEPGGNIWDV